MHWRKPVHRYAHTQILSGYLVHCALYGAWVVRLSGYGFGEPQVGKRFDSRLFLLH